MTSDLNTHSKPRLPLEPGRLAVLNSEIEFWQEMIATCPLTQSSECIERMRQALALAESRLAEMSSSALAARTAGSSTMARDTTDEPAPEASSQVGQ